LLQLAVGLAFHRLDAIVDIGLGRLLEVGHRQACFRGGCFLGRGLGLGGRLLRLVALGLLLALAAQLLPFHHFHGVEVVELVLGLVADLGCIGVVLGAVLLLDALGISIGLLAVLLTIGGHGREPLVLGVGVVQVRIGLAIDIPVARLVQLPHFLFLGRGLGAG